jgi:hypothetical protein
MPPLPVFIAGALSSGGRVVSVGSAVGNAGGVVVPLMVGFALGLVVLVGGNVVLLGTVVLLSDALLELEGALDEEAPVEFTPSPVGSGPDSDASEPQAVSAHAANRAERVAKQR